MPQLITPQFMNSAYPLRRCRRTRARASSITARFSGVSEAREAATVVGRAAVTRVFLRAIQLFLVFGCPDVMIRYFRSLSLRCQSRTAFNAHSGVTMRRSMSLRQWLGRPSSRPPDETQRSRGQGWLRHHLEILRQDLHYHLRV